MARDATFRWLRLVSWVLWIHPCRSGANWKRSRRDVSCYCRGCRRWFRVEKGRVEPFKPRVLKNG